MSYDEYWGFWQTLSRWKSLRSSAPLGWPGSVVASEGRRRCLGHDLGVELLLCNCLLDLRDRRSQSCDLIVSVWYRAHVRVRFWGAGLAQVLIVEVQVAGSSILQVGQQRDGPA